MTTQKKENTNLTILTKGLQTKIASVDTSDSVLAALLDYKLGILAKDIEALSIGDYVTMDIQEVTFLIEKLYALKNLVEVRNLVWAMPGSSSIWRKQTTNEQIYDLTSQAAARGIEINHVFVVEECLRFAAMSEEFKFATKLVRNHAKVVLMEVHKRDWDCPLDFMLFILSGNKKLALSTDLYAGHTENPLFHLLSAQPKLKDVCVMWDQLSLAKLGVRLMEI